MRLLHAIHTVDPALGGPIEAVKQSSAGLVRQGHTVEIASLDAPDAAWVRDSSVPVHARGPGRGGYGYAPGFLQWIKDHRHHYDAVSVHGIWQYHSFGVWRALAGSTTPYFVFP